MTETPQIDWPDGKKFAFTIFDDPDSQSWEAGRETYALLKDLGYRTTKGVWPMAPVRTASDAGLTCAHPGYVDWIHSLAEAGFEVGYHNAMPHTSSRQETLQGLEAFRQLFGGYPRTFTQHYYCQESLYWGRFRLSGWRRLLYSILTRFQNRNASFGHIEGHDYYWGDLCRDRIDYCRNFTFADVNTLKAWPFFPYHDPDRPFVKRWFCSSEGSNRSRFCRTLSEDGQERLEEEGGLCIMYTHFGHGYYDGGLDPRFVNLMQRLASRQGWFAPVGTILDYLNERQGTFVLDRRMRADLETKWLRHKILYGSA